MSIKFSVLVPVYNVERYIHECIESVLRQTYTQFELILVDDGSSDRSGIICDEYAQKDSRIKVYHKKNQGLIHTRRYAISYASGDYYVFLDSDDTIKQDALAIIYNKIQKYDCDCIIYGLERVENGKVKSQTYDSIEELIYDKRTIYRKVFFSTEYNSLCRKAVKACVFHDVDYSPYYHLKYTEDLLQSLEIYKYSNAIAFIPDVLYEYRMNQSSITHGSDRMIVDYTIRKRVLEFLRDESVFSDNDYNVYRDFCLNMVIGHILKFSLLHEDYKTIIKKFSEIREDTYYQEFLSAGFSNCTFFSFRSIIFFLFSHKKYITLINLAKVGHLLKSIIHKYLK